MRIIAGKHRGRLLAGFRGMEIRPTPDRVKESLFQILTPRLAGARVLDLFCGSGALGLESLSRGAREAVFNDGSRESLAVLKKNLTALKETGRIYNLDYRSCLKSVTGKFGLIFCDPPYQADFCADVLALVKERDVLEEGGLVVYESEREEAPAAGFALADRRNYGRTNVFLFERRKDREE